MSRLFRPARLAVLLTLCLVIGLSSPAAAGKGGKGGGKGGGGGNGGGGNGALPTAVVSLGDSYVSGEGGRWQGNWASSTRDRGGTDRAAYKRWGLWFYDADRIYGSTDATGCHRSDVSPIISAALDADATINLACSGAATNNVVSAANGGVSHRGEAPQADQLGAVAVTHDVTVVVLSIGGNDLGFADAITDCTVKYTTSPSWFPNYCHDEQGPRVTNAMPAAMAGVARSIDDVRAALASAGDTEYRLILAGYPSPVPMGSDFRYLQSGWDRTFTGGCPFWNADADWARGQLVPQIADGLAAVAAQEGVEFLDLRDAFNGREVCASSAAQGSGSSAEWGRFLSTGITQGGAQESLHPNALGQVAVGTCIRLVVEAAPGSYRCTNVAGSGPDTMSLATS